MLRGTIDPLQWEHMLSYAQLLREKGTLSDSGLLFFYITVSATAIKKCQTEVQSYYIRPTLHLKNNSS